MTVIEVGIWFALAGLLVLAAVSLCILIADFREMRRMQMETAEEIIRRCNARPFPPYRSADYRNAR
jgi:hypothetical protein